MGTHQVHLAEEALSQQLPLHQVGRPEDPLVLWLDAERLGTTQVVRWLAAARSGVTAMQGV